MAGEWPRVPISHVGTTVIGGTPSRSVADDGDDSVPWATAKDVGAVSGRYLEQVAECITEEKVARPVAQLRERQAEVVKLDAAITKNLHELEFRENPR